MILYDALLIVKNVSDSNSIRPVSSTDAVTLEFLIKLFNNMQNVSEFKSVYILLKTYFLPLICI